MKDCPYFYTLHLTGEACCHLDLKDDTGCKDCSVGAMWEKQQKQEAALRELRALAETNPHCSIGHALEHCVDLSTLKLN
ncbi:hypothetical protein [Pseudodesulfovibrio pelocollis]|uniref:hypothetical protein n=1 Tax=Pseudodesulfovibrio pelocollis TaxID=3051432 RepID=UPI00255ACEC1|nr:hypothetical protein [Pseudodesulfovibrio sp. SB368]